MEQKKIFVIGPNKCGTISLYFFFKKNNLRPIHWDKGNLALKILSNISANLKPLNGLDKFNCFLDMYFITTGLYISPISLRDKIITHYPDDIFILNIRNFDDWLISRKKHGSGSLDERLNKTFKDSYDPELEYNSYKDIINYNLKNFHIFNLDEPDKFTKLSKFLSSKGINIFDTAEIHEHKTKI
tara:strand:+ start:6643 stop:7197 length:555 start_codon:yes stop_codon:yes gene_type:complete